MSNAKVYPWWQPASDLATADGYDDKALERLMLSSSGLQEKFPLSTPKGAHPNVDLRGAARTAVSELIWKSLVDGSLPGYRANGQLMEQGEINPDDVTLSGVCVEPSSVNTLLKAKGHLEVWQPNAPKLARGRGMPAQRAQEEEVLNVLRTLGHDPMQLPQRTLGKPGVKAAVRNAIGRAGAWAGATVFDKTWERLRQSGQIAEA